MQIIVELAPFKLVSGVSPENLLDASMHVQNDFLSQQPGFIGRELFKGKRQGFSHLKNLVTYHKS